MNNVVNGVDVTTCERLIITDKKKRLCGLGGECSLFDDCEFKHSKRVEKENLEYMKLYNKEVKKNKELQAQNQRLTNNIKALEHRIAQLSK